MATLKPNAAFNAWNDATSLRHAMKGLGTNEAEIIQVLTKRTLRERLEIQTKYFEQFGRDLHADLKSELGGHFEKLILALLEPIPEFLARELNRAVVGIGTDDSDLKGIICTLTPQEVTDVSASYEKLFGIPLASAVGSDVSGDYKTLLVSLLTTARKAEVNPGAAETTAKHLYNAGEGRLGTNEAVFIQVLSENSYNQLSLVFREYEKISGKIFLHAVDEEMSGALKKGIQLVAQAVTNLPKVYAEQLRAAMEGAGTDESTLIRVLVWRSEKDLALVKHEYEQLYGKGLATSLRNETSGDFKNALISIIEETRETCFTRRTTDRTS